MIDVSIEYPSNALGNFSECFVRFEHLGMCIKQVINISLCPKEVVVS